MFSNRKQKCLYKQKKPTVFTIGFCSPNRQKMQAKWVNWIWNY